jgi:hypothetical protein
LSSSEGIPESAWHIVERAIKRTIVTIFFLVLLDSRTMVDYVGLCWYVLAAGPPKGPASNPKVRIL